MMWDLMVKKVVKMVGEFYFPQRDKLRILKGVVRKVRGAEDFGIFMGFRVTSVFRSDDLLIFFIFIYKDS